MVQEQVAMPAPGLGADVSASTRLRDAAIWGAALLACLWVLIANGGALFYYDTGAYVERSQQMLMMAGIDPPRPVVAPRTDFGDTVAPPPEDGPRTIDGSRTPAYAALLAVFGVLGALEGVVLFNAVVVLLSFWLPVRVALRLYLPGHRAAPLVAAGIGLAALGSLSFYVDYLMADILAPVLLVMVATLVAFAPRMRRWELALAFAIAVLAMVVHLSHVAIAGLLLPVTLIAALLQRREGWRCLIAPALILGVLAMGFAEQKIFRVAAKVAENAEVVYRPFVTARLIQDGPGYLYLQDHCAAGAPRDAIACPLWDALQLSNDPWRLTATHIVFEGSPELGSFQRMTAADRRAVAVNQFHFFFEVLRERPVGVVLALLGNTLRQAGMNSVDMTLQTDEIVQRNGTLPGLALGGFRHGRLTADPSWLGFADPAQNVLYALSLVAVAVLMLAPRLLPGRLRAFLLLIVIGILINAFVCGGISQPATRYGSRVIWLLPAAAATFGLFAALWRRGGATGKGA